MLCRRQSLERKTELLDNALRVGVDLGGTKVHSVVLSSSNEVLSKDVRLSGHGNLEVMTNLKASINEALSQLGEPKASAASIGIGTPGTVDTASGSVSFSLNLGIEQLELGQLLGQEFGCKVSVHNDVNATAAGLSILNPALHSLAYLNFGTGLAVGFVLEGKEVSGYSGLSGEIGHLPVGTSSEGCPCGQRGCLELYTSWSGLKRHAPTFETYAELVEAMEEGRADEIRELFLANAIRAITAVFLSLDPERVFIGGGLISGWPGAYEAILDNWKKTSEATALFSSKNLSSRISLLPEDLPVAAIGALGV